MEEENEGSPLRGENYPSTLPETQNSDNLSIVDQVDEDFEEQDIEVPLGDEGNDLDDEDRRSSSTPTQDDNVSPVGGIKITSVPPLQARLTDRLLSTLSESHDINSSLAFNTLIDNQEYHQLSCDVRRKSGDPIDVSDDDLAEEHTGAEEKLARTSISRASEDTGELANLSPVSNSSLNLLESRRLNEDDISLSDLSDPESGKNSFRKSDLEDGEIFGKNRPASVSSISSPKRNQQRLRRRGSASSDDSSSRKSDSLEKGSAMSDTSKPESPRPSKVIRGGSTEFRQTDKRSSRIRRDAASIDPETSPRQNAPSTRSRRRCELPRYDVRNIIVNKRDARRKRKDSVSQSKSRSRSRSRNRLRRRSRGRSRNRSSSRGRRRSHSNSKSRSKSRARRRSFSREKKRSARRRTISNERSRNGRRSRSRSYRSRSRSRSRSLSSFSRRRNSSEERRRKKPKRNNKEPKRRLRGRRSRSPSVIIEQVNIRRSASPYPVSSTSKRRRKARSPTPPPLRKKTKASKKLVTKSDKLRKKSVLKKGKTKKSREDVGKGKKKKSRKLNVVGGSLVDGDLSNINTHVSSEVADKEVFTSGDKIMVSVNFRSREPRRVTPSPPRRNRPTKQKLAAVSQKPLCVIDMLSSPYRIIEDSPKEIVEILSDSEEELNNKKQAGGTNNNNNNVRGKAANKRNSPKGSSDVITILNSPPQTLRTPDKSNQQQSSQTQQLSQSNQQPQQQSNQQPLPLLLQQSQLALAQFETTIVGGDVFIQTGHKGPCTPPPVDTTIDLTRGPQTPSDPPDDSYDPCNPTESPVNMWDSQGPSHLNDVPKSSEKNIRIIDYNNSVTTNGNKDTINSILSAAVKALPFLFEDANGTTNGNGTSGLNLKMADDDRDHDNMDLCDDMDIGSPNSPQSSEMSDMFEPPLNTPKKIHLNSQRGKTDPHKSKKGGKLVHMKMVDDKLRIIDDVPSSAVEMAVKEKFLIKVQRQERAVDEIKMVLKPFYNRKKIDKEAYKEILRKCVPKVCHSKKGDINPQKIHKLVTGYVKRYIHLKRRGQQHSF